MKIVDISSKLPRHPTKTNKIRKLTDIKRIVLHTTDDDATPQAIAKYDVGPNHICATGNPSITYHYIVMNDGTIYKTLDETEISWHCGNWNGGSVGVAIMYKCTNKKGEDVFAPSQAAIDASISLLVDLRATFKLDKASVVGHRELPGYFKIVNFTKIFLKTCPGLQIDMDVMRDLVDKQLKKV